jgi:hypothetical protein
MVAFAVVVDHELRERTTKVPITQRYDPVLSQIAAERVQPAAEHFTRLAHRNSASHRAADADGSRPHVASARSHR